MCALNFYHFMVKTVMVSIISCLLCFTSYIYAQSPSQSTSHTPATQTQSNSKSSSKSSSQSITPRPHRPFETHLELLTDFPLEIGARLSIMHTKTRLSLATSLGWLPKPYLVLLNHTLTSLDLYSEETANLIETVLENSLVLRIDLGWQPWKHYGFYFDAGYGYVGLGGGVTTEEIVSSLTNITPPQGGRRTATTREFAVSSTLHMFDIEAGWTWNVSSRWYMRAALGFALTFAAQTDVEAQYKVQAQNIINALEGGLEKYLDDIYTQYVFTPTMTLAVGYNL